jgi:hypothetical protein
MTRSLFVALVAVFATGCHREHKVTPAEASASSRTESPAASGRPGIATIAEAIASVDLRVEARRGTAHAFEPVMEQQRAALDAHFKEPTPFPLAFQVVSAGVGRHAVLLQATRDEARPFIWLLDEAGNTVWTKERPTGGVKPGITEISLASGPDGHVCLAWCNAASESVALRRWAEDGGAFADYDVIHVDACSALSVVYWPRRGWLVSVAGPGGATFELISENGALRWGRDGVSLPWTFRAAAPLSLSLDTPDSVMFFRLGQSGGPASAEYVFASRYSVEGRPLWPGPLSLKRLPAPVRDPAIRLLLAPGPEGTIRAELPAVVSGGPEDVVLDVASDGAVARH